MNISFRLALTEYKNWMQCPRYIPVDSHKRPHYSTAEANKLSYSFVCPIIIWNTKNRTGERAITDVLQEDEKKTAEPEVGRRQEQHAGRATVKSGYKSTVKFQFKSVFFMTCGPVSGLVNYIYTTCYT